MDNAESACAHGAGAARSDDEDKLERAATGFASEMDAAMAGNADAADSDEDAPEGPHVELWFRDIRMSEHAKRGASLRSAMVDFDDLVRATLSRRRRGVDPEPPPEEAEAYGSVEEVRRPEGPGTYSGHLRWRLGRAKFDMIFRRLPDFGGASACRDLLTLMSRRREVVSVGFLMSVHDGLCRGDAHASFGVDDGMLPDLISALTLQPDQ